MRHGGGGRVKIGAPGAIGPECRRRWDSALQSSFASSSRRLPDSKFGIIPHGLSTIEYAGNDESAVRRPDALIMGGPELAGSGCADERDSD